MMKGRSSLAQALAVVFGLCAAAIMLWSGGGGGEASGERLLLQRQEEGRLLYSELEYKPMNWNREPRPPSLRLVFAIWSDGLVAIDVGSDQPDFRTAWVDHEEIEEFLQDAASHGLASIPPRGGVMIVPDASISLMGFHDDEQARVHGWTKSDEALGIPRTFLLRWSYTKVRARELIARTLPTAGVKGGEAERIERLDIGRILRSI